MSWEKFKVGAGGFVTGLDIAADGTKVVRTDAYGAYYHNPESGIWQQIITKDSMPALEEGRSQGEGTLDVVIAPTNTQRFYLMFGGEVYRSENRGAFWTRTAFQRIAADANDVPTKLFGHYLAVDPANADVIYASSPNDGLYVSSDAGNSWSRLRPVGNATACCGTRQGGGHLVAFDPTSGVKDGKTQGIYVSTFGEGVYHSTDGGSTWSLTIGTPTTHVHMIVDQRGIVWLTDTDGGSGVSGRLNRFRGGSWRSMLGPSSQSHSIAVDPANPDDVVVGTNGGQLYLSTDGGATFVGPTRIRRAANDVPWLAWTNESFMSNGDMQFDKSVAGRLYFAEGIGVWYSDKPVSKTETLWNSMSAGLELLVSNWAISPPGGAPIFTFWDRPIFLGKDPNVYPSKHGLNDAHAIVHGWSADWASSEPSTIVALANVPEGIDTSGYSKDGGRTWRLFESNMPATANSTAGGCIAASSSSNFLWMPADNKPRANTPWYTTNAGKSWTAVAIPGVPDAGGTGWGFAYYLDRQICAADRVNANTFYLYNDGGGNAQSAGVYRSADGGATWSHVYRSSFPNSSFNAQMRSVPGQAGHLFFTAGWQTGTHPANQSFYRSFDGGVTWRAVMNVKEVSSFGFGKPAPGRQYPAIFIYGWVRNVSGVWRSDDNALTWTQVADRFPLGISSKIKVIEGDNNIYGTVYVGFVGAGFGYGRLN